MPASRVFAQDTLREKRGLTQQQLAEATKTDWTQISRYERDVNLPTADRVVALADMADAITTRVFFQHG